MALRADFTDISPTQSDHPNHHNALATAVNTLTDAAPYTVTQELSASAPTVTFSGIPRTLRRIRLQISCRSDTAANYSNVVLRFGAGAVADSSANYGYMFYYSQNGPAQNQLSSANTNGILVGYCPGATLAVGRYSSITVDLPGWNLPGRTPSVMSCNFTGGYIVGTNFITSMGNGEYVGAVSPLNTIVLLSSVGNLVAGSQFTLWGQY